MDAIELLLRQHRELEAAMKEVLEAGDDDAGGGLFADVADALTVHITSEEQVFYPAVKARRTEDILLESLEEHLSLKRLLADLLELDVAAPAFEPKFKVLMEQAEHHHDEEEKHLFPKVSKLIDAAQREALGMEMLALQRHLERVGAPRALVRQETDAAAPL